MVPAPPGAGAAAAVAPPVGGGADDIVAAGRLAHPAVSSITTETPRTNPCLIIAHPFWPVLGPAAAATARPADSRPTPGAGPRRSARRWSTSPVARESAARAAAGAPPPRGDRCRH